MAGVLSFIVQQLNRKGRQVEMPIIAHEKLLCSGAAAALRCSAVCRDRSSATPPRNTTTLKIVGVIDVAVFNERGTNPWTSPELQRRLNANPFPGRFVTSPWR
jgi:hypothetical protein